MKLSVVLKAILGFVALLFATIGLFLPLWPTTPFVLLAIACFSGMPKMRARILRIRVFCEYHESYTKGAGLSRKTLCMSLGVLWGMLCLSMLLLQNLWLLLLLFCVGFAVTAHLLWMARPKKKPEGEEASHAKKEEDERLDGASL